MLKCPEEGFEWKGKGDPKSSRGSWNNPQTGESLHPDVNYPMPIKPHWDYTGSKGKSRLFLDGSWEMKKLKK